MAGIGPSKAATALRNGQDFIIYALACPITLEVKYVGQTNDLEKRERTHRRRNCRIPHLQRWLESLGHLKPYRIILERGVNRPVTVKDLHSDKQGAARPHGTKTVWLSSCLEAKWVKRFRRTALNQRGLVSVDQALKNPPLPWEGEAPE